MSAKSGMRVRGTSGVVANLYAWNRNVRKGIQRATTRAGRETKDMMYALAPKDTYFMADALTLEFTPQMMGFSVYLDPDDFKAEGLSFYPPYVELGTFNSPAQPFMTPVWEYMGPQYKADVGSVIRRHTSGKR